MTRMTGTQALVAVALCAPLVAVAPQAADHVGSAARPAPEVLSEIRSTPAGGASGPRPSWLRWDPGAGAVVAGASPTVLPAAAAGGVRLRWDESSQLVTGLDPSGEVVAAWDATTLGVDSVTSMVVAPSSDRTDDAPVTSLYLLDRRRGSGETRVVEATTTSASTAAAVSGSLVRSVRTSSYSPPSPDPSGITYLPDLDRMIIVDGEVDEMSIFNGVNLFETSRAGVQTRNGVTQPWSNEPTGAGYNPANHHLFVSDDSQREIFEITSGSDGKYGTSDDSVTHFDTLGAGNDDPEDVAYDGPTTSVWTIDGLNKEVFRYQPGPDARLGTSDDVRSHFDVGVYGAVDPEGIDYDAVRDTLVVVDDKSDRIYELDRTGALLNTISTSSLSLANAAAGITVAPGSSNSSVRNYYVVSRGVDNNNDPNENDGMFYEIAASLPPTGGGTNQPPV